jgi:uncharacterized protein YaiI (UPF0178 family)
MMDIYIDIDAHEVFRQVLQAAQRHDLELYVVTRDYLQADLNVHLILDEDRSSNRCAWIESNILRGDICVTGDPGVATSCILKGALALTPLGGQWPRDIVGDDARNLAGRVTERWTPDPRIFAQRLERAIATQGIELRAFAMSRGLLRETAETGLSRLALSEAIHS